MSRKNIVFHVGLPKSASTSLQKNLFYKHSQIHSLSIYPNDNIGIDEGDDFNLPDDINYIYDVICTKDSIDCTPEVIKDCKNLIERRTSFDKVNVLSNERVTSVLFSHKDRFVKAERIFKMVPNVKILIIIRNQINLIKSQYRDHPFDLRAVGAVNIPVSIDDWILRDLSRVDVSFMESLDYYKLIKSYETIFGKNKIKIMLFEDLISQKLSFSRELSDFLDINEDETFKHLSAEKRNAGVSKNFNKYRWLKSKLLLFIPRFVKGSNAIKELDMKVQKLLKRGQQENIKLNDKSHDIILGMYSDSNKRLMLEYKLNLNKYGYPL